jgi:hypothetical protein
MPSDPLILTIRDEIVALAETISKANGYHLDYGRVQAGAVADWEAEKDFDRPGIFIAWDGEAPGDDIVGGETATQRFRRMERFLVSVCVKSRDPETRAWKIRADLNACFLSESGRFLTAGRGAIFETGTEWFAFPEAGTPIGGTLAVLLTVRWEHQSGDMSTT